MKQPTMKTILELLAKHFEDDRTNFQLITERHDKIEEMLKTMKKTQEDHYSEGVTFRTEANATLNTIKESVAPLIQIRKESLIVNKKLEGYGSIILTLAKYIAALSTITYSVYFAYKRLFHG